jgi:hypothetical protein
MEGDTTVEPAQEPAQPGSSQQTTSAETCKPQVDRILHVFTDRMRLRNIYAQEEIRALREAPGITLAPRQLIALDGLLDQLGAINCEFPPGDTMTHIQLHQVYNMLMDIEKAMLTLLLLSPRDEIEGAGRDELFSTRGGQNGGEPAQLGPDSP